MEAKSIHRVPMTKDITRFLAEVKAEMAKVVWPSWHDLVASTIIVLILVTIFAIYLGAVDLVLSKAAELFLFGVRA